MTRRRSPNPKPAEPSPTVHPLTIDRFETDHAGAGLAVLVTDDGHSIVVPQRFLPTGAAPGMVLSLSLTIDPAATAAVARNVGAIRADLQKTDPGGTIQL